MKKNGFTLVELLAMLVVLGILMGVAIPNISGIIKNNKLNIIKTDAIKMIDTAKVKMSTDKEIKEKPTTNKCIVMALNYLNDSEDINTGPNGGKYMQFDSFVVITREGNEYKYYVRLIEKTGNEYYGINIVDRTALSAKNSDYIKKVDTLYNLNGGSEAIASDKAKLAGKLKASYPSVKDLACTTILSYHPGYKLN